MDRVYLSEEMLNLSPNGSTAAEGGGDEGFEEIHMSSASKGLIFSHSINPEMVVDTSALPPGLGENAFTGAGNYNSSDHQMGDELRVYDSVAGLAFQTTKLERVTGASIEPSGLASRKKNALSGVEGEEIERVSTYPVPLTPFSGETEKAIEYDRAMVAESAMKSGPAIGRSDILFEDEWLMVINKPCGIYSEHVLATIPSLLQTAPHVARPDSSLKEGKVIRDEVQIHMANRLDRDTSGVMVITKSKKAAGMMSKIFTTRWVQKSYLALCAARPPEWRHLTLESGHGRSRFGAWRVYAKRDVGRELPGKCLVKGMKTHFAVVAVNKELVVQQENSGALPTGHSWWEEPKAENSWLIAGEEQTKNDGRYPSAPPEDLVHEMSTKWSLKDNGDEVIIRAFPFTGRTHQIRLHCQYLRLSLRGDVKYGGPHIWNGVQYDHHALHAETLSFRHPFTSEKLFFAAPLPQWARDAGVQTHQP
ncbi:hypothetical protein R1flu_012438 [Riccia fluitans]|uniref:Pseudouridine synthase RsuA/RluA-like domain-containing protein n=1 Tax=Riccia fluitans TaxID=41844 RepID=A0ABD1ZAY1_9MARC